MEGVRKGILMTSSASQFTVGEVTVQMLHQKGPTHNLSRTNRVQRPGTSRILSDVPPTMPGCIGFAVGPVNTTWDLETQWGFQPVGFSDFGSMGSYFNSQLNLQPFLFSRFGFQAVACFNNSGFIQLWMSVGSLPFVVAFTTLLRPSGQNYFPSLPTPFSANLPIPLTGNSYVLVGWSPPISPAPWFFISLDTNWTMKGNALPGYWNGILRNF